MCPILSCPALPCPAVADSWSKVNTGTYLGTIGFAYLCFVMFLLFFFALVVFQSAVNEELGLRKCSTNYAAQGLSTSATCNSISCTA